MWTCTRDACYVYAHTISDEWHTVHARTREHTHSDVTCEHPAKAPGAIAASPEKVRSRFVPPNPEQQLVSVRPTAVHPARRHTPAPGPLVVPDAHATHVLADVAPTAFEAVPAPHCVHVAAPPPLAS